MHSGKKPNPETSITIKKLSEIIYFYFSLEFALTVPVPFSSSICLNLGASEVFCSIWLSFANP